MKATNNSKQRHDTLSEGKMENASRCTNKTTIEKEPRKLSDDARAASMACIHLPRLVTVNPPRPSFPTPRPQTIRFLAKISSCLQQVVRQAIHSALSNKSPFFLHNLPPALYHRSLHHVSPKPYHFSSPDLHPRLRRRLRHRHGALITPVGQCPCLTTTSLDKKTL